MSILTAIRRLLGRADAAVADVELAAIDAVHRLEDEIDEATGGRFYDAVEKLDEEADELGERLHLEDPRAE